VDNGRNGFLVSPNPHALAEGLEKLILDQKLRVAMGREARETALQNFDMETSLGKLIKIYSD